MSSCGPLECLSEVSVRRPTERAAPSRPRRRWTSSHGSSRRSGVGRRGRGDRIGAGPRRRGAAASTLAIRTGLSETPKSASRTSLDGTPSRDGHLRDPAAQRVVAGAAGHLDAGGAASLRRGWELDRGQDLALLEASWSESWRRGRPRRPTASTPAADRASPSRPGRRTTAGQLAPPGRRGRRCRRRSRASGSGDGRRCGGRLGRSGQSSCEERGWSRRRAGVAIAPTTTVSPSCADRVEAVDSAQVHQQVGVGEPHAQQRHQALAAGEHLGVGVVVGEQPPPPRSRLSGAA